VTKRLHYDDPYLTQFEAQVLRRLEVGGRPAVILDRSAFYPEGGGQPADVGLLGRIPVVDVQELEGEVVHVLAGPLPPEVEVVAGQVDWQSRFDHMQQHTGQHILSQACLRVLGAETVAFHLGKSITTIDLDQPGLTGADLQEAETLANAVVAENRAVQASFVSEEELAQLPLRRPVAISGPVRVVQVDGFDLSACGGTHVRSTAEVGGIKITRVDRRGMETRVGFLCGRRAFADYRRKHAVVTALSEMLTTGEDQLVEAIRRLEAELKATGKALRRAQEQIAQLEAPRFWAQAEIRGSLHIVARWFEDRSLDQVKTLAQTLREQPNTVALLAWRDGKAGRVMLFFTRSEGVSADMGELMRIACAVLGGKGGGRADWAQGGASSGRRLEQALDAALRNL